MFPKDRRSFEVPKSRSREVDGVGNVCECAKLADLIDAAEAGEGFEYELRSDKQDKHSYLYNLCLGWASATVRKGRAK
jgi:hypothetical protein